jgi:hypothetical protein
VQDSPGAAAAANSQTLEIGTEKGGAILGIATISPAPALLSAPIYKICTLLSTGIVENIARRRAPPGRKALSGAAFGGMAGLP